MNFVLSIDGMTCGGCVRSVEKALAGVAGVRSVAVDLAAARAVVDADATDAASLVDAVEAAGFDARSID